MKTKFNKVVLFLAVMLSISLTSCKEDTKEKMKEAGEAVVDDTKEAAEKVGESTERAAEKVGESIENAVDKAGEEIDKMTRRVSFKSGESSAIIEGKLKGEEYIDYLINVKSGQSMNVSMTTDNSANYFNIMEPNEESVAIFIGSTEGSQYEGVTSKSGDYRIRVYLMRSAARRGETANYRLEVIVN